MPTGRIESEKTVKEENSEECKKIRLLEKVAAFVDGEGNIGIQKHVAPSGNYAYHQYLYVVNTDIRLIEWLVENFGGKIPNPKKGKKENHKDAYYWNLNGSYSYKIIKKMRPYLILKQEQADCAIELYEKVSKFRYGNTPIPVHKIKLSEELYQRCRDLNKKGKSNNEEVEVLVPIKVRKDALNSWLGQ